MRTQTTRPCPAGLRTLQRRFQQWRRNRQGRSRIPLPMWAAAVQAAARYGLCRTARTLGLDYTTLKKHAAAGGDDNRKPAVAHWGVGTDHPGAVDGATFVELPRITPDGGCDCVVEWEDPAGGRMRAYLKGAQAAHVAAMVGRLVGAA
jgi:hypothetical protein